MKKMWLRIVSLCLVTGMLAGCFAGCGGSSSEKALTAVREALIKDSEIENFGAIDKMELYVNGERTESDEYVQVKDNKKIYYSGDTKRVVNYPDGYSLDIPADWVPDYSLATVRCRYVNDEVTLFATNEDGMYATYKSGEDYVKDVFQYITSADYMKKNKVKKLEEKTEKYDKYKAYILKMHLSCPEGYKCYYTYVVYYDNVKRAVQLMFKCVDDRDFEPVYSTFRGFGTKGTAVDTKTYPRSDNKNWNEETGQYYHSIADKDEVTWGIFLGNLNENRVLRGQLKQIEKKLDFEFPIVMSYTEMDWDFPKNGMTELYNEFGRHTQYTYHTSTWNDTNSMGSESRLLQCYRGARDDEIIRMAQQIAAFGKPMLFRVNNEMNSNWTTWSAVNNMLDPEIFTDVWTRLYDIFTEQGANQYCIWVWNPQGCRSYPHTNWDEIRNYMPGEQYVDMIGLTSYNFGNENNWSSFQSMYDADQEYFGKYFSDWAWIIGEFGCSDTVEPSRKAQWITEMFDCFEQKRYPNIKAAVWFSCNDYEGNVVTHRLVLDESKETLAAFSDGIKRTVTQQ